MLYDYNINEIKKMNDIKLKIFYEYFGEDILLNNFIKRMNEWII